MIPDRYNIQNLKKAIHNPSLFISEINKVPSWITKPPRRWVNKAYLYHKYGTPIDLMEKDWDNLIILDACRYDIFRDLNHIQGELSRVVTPGSKSDEFIIANFNGRKLHDTVYISANPHTDKTLQSDSIFHKVIRTYSTTRYTHRELQGYHPEEVFNAAVENHKEYDDKRIITHFMQPHTPYIGEYATKVRKQLLESEGVAIREGNNLIENAKGYETEKEYLFFFDAVKDGHISNNQLKEMYMENLEIVLTYVNDLIDELRGKTVVTADHGELLGDPTAPLPVMMRYKHPRKNYAPELRVVPWLEVNFDSRREVTPDPPKPNDEAPEQMVKEHLKALGYRQN